MNERIEKLVIETLGKQGVPERRAFGHWAMSDEQMVKFAELIVRECAGIIDSHKQMALPGEHGRNVSGNDLKEHFGVK